jgi:LPS-assembly lipoprotein
MYIALPETAEVNIWLQRYINASGSTEIVADAKTADATFQQLPTAARRPF